MDTLLGLQKACGSWEYSDAFRTAVGYTNLVDEMGPKSAEDREIICTLYAIVRLESDFAAFSDQWGSAVANAKRWIESKGSFIDSENTTWTFSGPYVAADRDAPPADPFVKVYTIRDPAPKND